MPKYTKKYILTEEIMYLPMSDEFKVAASRMGFKTIQQILDTPQQELNRRNVHYDQFMIDLGELAEEYGFLHTLESRR
ncbi:MAG: hypothetical protein ABI675_25555 [Chitinophagaceae bacterium]